MELARMIVDLADKVWSYRLDHVTLETNLLFRTLLVNPKSPANTISSSTPRDHIIPGIGA